MLAKEESISRLKLMWGQTPFDDIDCAIGRTEWINSYCVSMGVGDMFNFFAEGSDIPKPVTNQDSMTTGSRIDPGADLLHRMKVALASQASKQDGATSVCSASLETRRSKGCAY